MSALYFAAGLGAGVSVSHLGASSLAVTLIFAGISAVATIAAVSLER